MSGETPAWFFARAAAPCACLPPQRHSQELHGQHPQVLGTAAHFPAHIANAWPEVPRGLHRKCGVTCTRGHCLLHVRRGSGGLFVDPAQDLRRPRGRRAHQYARRETHARKNPSPTVFREKTVAQPTPAPLAFNRRRTSGNFHFDFSFLLDKPLPSLCAAYLFSQQNKAKKKK